MSIYEQLLNAAENGKPYKINFKKRYLEVDGKVLVDGGKCKETYGFEPKWDKEYVEELYVNYYTSRPSERSEKSRSYFYAMPQSEMDDLQIVVGENRLVAQAKLEGVVLGLLLENYPYENLTDEKHTFWQSEKYPGLILWREWFTGECL